MRQTTAPDRAFLKIMPHGVAQVNAAASDNARLFISRGARSIALLPAIYSFIVKTHLNLSLIEETLNIYSLCPYTFSQWKNLPKC